MPDKNYEWNHAQGHATLRRSGSVLVDYSAISNERAAFIYHGQPHEIIARGFWNPTIEITKNGAVLFTLKRGLFKSKGAVQVGHHTRFVAKIKNAPSMKLTLETPNEDRLLSYRFKARSRSPVALKVYDADISETDLVILLVLGFFCFNGMLTEHNLSATKEKVPYR